MQFPIDDHTCPLCGCNKAKVYDELQRKLFDGSNFLGQPTLFWVRVKDWLARRNIKDLDQLERSGR